MIMAGVVAMASVIEDFDTQVCKYNWLVYIMNLLLNNILMYVCLGSYTAVQEISK